MADDITIDNGALTDYVTAADDCSGALVQLVKLAYSADGVRTAATVDANGVLVSMAASKVDDAAFTVESDRVVMQGALAVAHGSDPNAADAADAAVPIMNRHRIPFVLGGHPNILTLKHANITTAVTNTAIVTVSTGSKIVVTKIIATLDNASTVFPSVLIGFATATTPTTTGVLMAHGGMPAGGGVQSGDGSGIIGIGADDEDVRVTTVGNATGNGVQIVITYFVIPT